MQSVLGFLFALMTGLTSSVTTNVNLFSNRVLNSHFIESSFAMEGLGNNDSFTVLASQIYSAAFNDVTPGFDDLYIIKTQDKGREIIIYCNVTYCYKNRNGLMTS